MLWVFRLPPTPKASARRDGAASDVVQMRDGVPFFKAILNNAMSIYCVARMRIGLACAMLSSEWLKVTAQMNRQMADQILAISQTTLQS
ncbi:MAG: hypothetical protein JWR19_609 [Pedosphaera sp.]|nr:hypothetical protein [Pedosphaera sp.]